MAKLFGIFGVVQMVCTSLPLPSAHQLANNSANMYPAFFMPERPIIIVGDKRRMDLATGAGGYSTPITKHAAVTEIVNQKKAGS